jgi:hypothetical protein
MIMSLTELDKEMIANGYQKSLIHPNTYAEFVRNVPEEEPLELPLLNFSEQAETVNTNEQNSGEEPLIVPALQF